MTLSERTERMADFVAERIEFLTFLACVCALVALLTGMPGEKALAFTAINLPFGLFLLVGLGFSATLSFAWRLPVTTLLLALPPMVIMDMGGAWMNPIAVWCVYGLLAFEVIWQARPRARLATQ